MPLKKTKEEEWVAWTPVFDVNGNGNFVGLSAKGIWYADTAEGLKLVNGPGIVGVLPVLERAKEEFLVFLDEKLRNMNIKNADLFPVERLVRFSFSVSTYWAELGIEWVDEKDIHDGLVQLLNEKIARKELSQKFRHTAYQKIKRWEQLHG